MLDENQDVIVVIGETGHGKSTYSNRLCSMDFKNQTFITSKSVNACTYKTTVKKDNDWFGNQKYGKVTVIDTPGFGDPNGDFENTKELISVLQGVKRIKAFVLVWNSQIVRFNCYTRQILDLFHYMFPDFWSNLIIVANFWPMNWMDRKKRKSEPPRQRTEKEFRAQIEDYVKEKYQVSSLKFTFMDLMYDEEDADEAAEYKAAGENFIQMVSALDWYETKHAKEQAYGLEKQQMQLEEVKKEQEDAEAKHIEVVGAIQKKADMIQEENEKQKIIYEKRTDELAKNVKKAQDNADKAQEQIYIAQQEALKKQNEHDQKMVKMQLDQAEKYKKQAQEQQDREQKLRDENRKGLENLHKEQQAQQKQNDEQTAKLLAQQKYDMANQMEEQNRKNREENDRACRAMQAEHDKKMQQGQRNSGGFLEDIGKFADQVFGWLF